MTREVVVRERSDYRLVMRWSEIRTAHPDQWLVIEALVARSADGHRILEAMAVVDTCTDGTVAMRTYRELQDLDPTRELYFVHTSNPELDIAERFTIRRNPWPRLLDADRQHPSPAEDDAEL